MLVNLINSIGSAMPASGVPSKYTLPCSTTWNQALCCPTVMSGWETQQKSAGRDTMSSSGISAPQVMVNAPLTRTAPRQPRANAPCWFIPLYLCDAPVVHQVCWTISESLFVWQAHAYTVAIPAGFQHLPFFFQQCPHGDIFPATSDPCTRQSGK